MPVSEKVISISVREFAVPVPRLGSLEAHSGFGPALQEGQQVHQTLQSLRSSTHSAYEAEVRVSAEFRRPGYLFRVSGRMDGLFKDEIPRIEEIKTCYQLEDLEKKLIELPMAHPYQLQLRSYGYFYFLKKSKLPKLSFHLVSLRDGRSVDLSVEWQISDYETWLETRLNSLVEEVKAFEAKVTRRKALASDFQFPFERPRKGQVELVKKIEDLSPDSLLMVQAPTGLGKTVGVLYPTLKESLSRGYGVIYVTPKNSQHAVAEDALSHFRSKGSEVRGMTLTAKSKICFKEEPVCDPKVCEFAQDYFTKVSENNLTLLLSPEPLLQEKHFVEYGEKFEVCPYQLQLEFLADRDVIIGDYNYVFSPKSSFLEALQPKLGFSGKMNLVVDEAHNLPDRAMSYYSPVLSTEALRPLYASIKTLPKRFQKEGERLLRECIDLILSHQSERELTPRKIEPKLSLFVSLDGEMKAWLAQYLQSSTEIKRGDVVLLFTRMWGDFTAALDFLKAPKREEFFSIFDPLGGTQEGAIRIICCNAAPQLQDIYKFFNQVVAFSATLKPFEFYSKLSGLDGGKLEVVEFLSPYSVTNRKLLVIPQISTSFKNREENYSKIAEAVLRISKLREGNYFIFFPSFTFLERVFDYFAAYTDFQIVKQTPGMKSLEISEVLRSLRSQAAPTLVFAVQGGVFSEGVDYPGDMLIGAFIVGPPLPHFDLAREEMKKYYDRTFGSGAEYAYVYPAMAKAIQAAGRVIRSEHDRGIIILMDRRFTQASYVQSMPTDWVSDQRRYPEVSGSILRDVSEFWESSPE